jgi:CRISPR-associated protein Csm4
MIIYLKPRSAFPELHSDTIFGALCRAISELYDDKTLRSIIAFDEKPPFILSSAFPFVYSNGEKIHFFPKPIEEPKKTDSVGMDIVKKWEKVNYIEETIFESWRAGEIDEDKILREFDRYKVSDGLFFDKSLKIPEASFWIRELISPRNEINRLTQASDNLFYSRGDYYRNAGLFFLVRFFDQKYKKIVEGAMRFLRDRGFGGDVSAGKGQFDFECEDTDILREITGERFITLSRYIPNGDELKCPGDCWYEIEMKRGRTAAGKVKKQIHFFVDGSTFPDLNKEYYGRIIKVEENANECGLAYNLAMKIWEI